MKNLIDRLERGEPLSRPDFISLLGGYRDPELAGCLAAKALAVRERHFGRDVFLRGLIEFTNHCRHDCFYCGLRRGNRHVERYRLTLPEIAARCDLGHSLGFRTFVLQGGEDPFFTADRLAEIVAALRGRFPDCALTLSVGEQPRETYQRLFDAGADRFLLRHETADADHYARLHPPAQTLAERFRCLYDLKEIGFQVGAGFMVGSPHQTAGHLAQDLLFLRELQPHMVGVGPFIPHPETPLAGFPPGDPDLTLFILGLIRLMLPKVLLPATTALGTLVPEARERALSFGANVLMPNLSPLDVREKYEIYTGKIHQGEEAAEGLARLQTRLAALGFRTPRSRGDYPG